MPLMLFVKYIYTVSYKVQMNKTYVAVQLTNVTCWVIQLAKCSPLCVPSSPSLTGTTDAASRAPTPALRRRTPLNASPSTRGFRLNAPNRIVRSLLFMTGNGRWRYENKCFHDTSCGKKCPFTEWVRDRGLRYVGAFWDVFLPISYSRLEEGYKMEIIERVYWVRARIGFIWIWIGLIDGLLRTLIDLRIP
jgi:hypothetical protein